MENAISASTQVQLSNPSKFTTTVGLVANDATAILYEDYGAIEQQVVFLPGETQKQIPLNILNDPLWPGRQPWWSTESFTVDLLPGPGYKINFSYGQSRQWISIQDEQSSPAINVTTSTPSVTEGTPSSLVFTLDNTFEETVRVKYEMYWDVENISLRELYDQLTPKQMCPGPLITLPYGAFIGTGEVEVEPDGPLSLNVPFTIRGNQLVDLPRKLRVRIAEVSQLGEPIPQYSLNQHEWEFPLLDDVTTSPTLASASLSYEVIDEPSTPSGYHSGGWTTATYRFNGGWAYKAKPSLSVVNGTASPGDIAISTKAADRGVVTARISALYDGIVEGNETFAVGGSIPGLGSSMITLPALSGTIIDVAPFVPQPRPLPRIDEGQPFTEKQSWETVFSVDDDSLDPNSIPGLPNLIEGAWYETDLDHPSGPRIERISTSTNGRDYFHITVDSHNKPMLIGSDGVPFMWTSSLLPSMSTPSMQSIDVFEGPGGTLVKFASMYIYLPKPEPLYAQVNWPDSTPSEVPITRSYRLSTKQVPTSCDTFKYVHTFRIESAIQIQHTFITPGTKTVTVAALPSSTQPLFTADDRVINLARTDSTRLQIQVLGTGVLSFDVVPSTLTVEPTAANVVDSPTLQKLGQLRDTNPLDLNSQYTVHVEWELSDGINSATVTTSGAVQGSREIYGIIPDHALFAPGNAVNAVISVTDKDSSTASSYSIAYTVITSPPTANDDMLSFAFGKAPLNASVIENDEFYGIADTTASLGSPIGVPRGILDLSTAGMVTYQPDPAVANYSVREGLLYSDQFEYYLINAYGQSQAATIQIDVTNTKPIAAADTFLVRSGKAKTLPVLQNDGDADGDALTIEIDTSPGQGPSHAAVAVVPGGIQYQSVNAYVGSDSFRYRVTDDLISSEWVTVAIMVDNRAPSASNALFEVFHDTTDNVIDLSAVIADADSDLLTITIDSNPNGTLTPVPDNSHLLFYTPPIGYTGSTSFSFRAFDGNLYSNTATATIVANNTAIASSDFAVSVIHDREILIDFAEHLEGVEVGESVEITISSPPGSGTLTLVDQLVYRYSPPASWTGVTSFEFSADDGASNTGTTTVSIDVTNIDPVAVADRRVGIVNQVYMLTVLANDIDADNDVLQIVSVGMPSGGSASVVDGAVHIVPPPDHIGEISVSYTITDGIAQSTATAVVDFRVNVPPQLFTSTSVSVVDGAMLGSYVGRLPVFDSDGGPINYELIPATGTSQPIADGLLSVDSRTGDLYLANDRLLGHGPMLRQLRFRATDSAGLTLVATIDVHLPAQNLNLISTSFLDAGSHGSGIAWDLRTTSVSAAGEALYTTLRDNDGSLVLPGGTFVEPNFGTYHVAVDGVLKFEPLSNLYRDRFTDFENSDTQPGVSYLGLPTRMLSLAVASGVAGPANAVLAPAVSGLNELASRRAFPKLTNTQPIAIDSQSATAAVRFLAANGNSLKVLPDDLLSFDLSAFFYDPDGDPIYASNPLSSRSGQLTWEPNQQFGLQTLIIDVVGDQLTNNGNLGVFSDSKLTVTITDGVDITGIALGSRLEIEFQNKNIGNRNGQYHLPEGITRVSHSKFYNSAWSGQRDYAVKRPDVNISGSQGKRIDSSYRWRWGKWKLSEQNGFVDRNSDNFIARGPVAFDPVDGSFVTSVDLGLDDELQDLPIDLGSLVYDSHSVSSTVYSHITVERPENETRTIHGFRVSVSHLDDRFSGQPFFVANATQRFTLPVTSTPEDGKFELTVPVLDTADPAIEKLIRGSGVYAYEVIVEPIFSSDLNIVGSNTSDSYPFSLVGRVPLFRNVSVTESDAQSAWGSVNLNQPLFGDGWQLSGLPQLAIDRGDPLLSEFLVDGTVHPTDSLSRPTVLLQMPGQDRVSVFRADQVTPEGQTHDLSGMTFTSIDVRTNLRDPEEFGTLTVNSNLELEYEDGFGTRYVFSRFNQQVSNGLIQATPYYVVTEIIPPDGNGVTLSYIDDTSLAGMPSPLTPTTNPTGNAITGPLRLHQIAASKQTGSATHQLTFQYNSAKRVDRIVFADGREITLGYLDVDGRPQLTTIDRFGLAAVTLDYAAATESQSDEPLLKSVTHSQTGIIDDVTAWKFKNGAVDEIYRGGTTLATATMLTKIDSVGERIRTPAGQGSASTFEVPDGGPLLEPSQYDEQRRDQIATSVRVADWADLQTYVGATSPPADHHGFHVTTRYLDDASNSLIVDSGFATGTANADPGSLSGVAQQRWLYDYDGRNYQIAMVDPLGRETITVYDHTHQRGQLAVGMTANHPEARGLPVLIGGPAGWTKIHRVTDNDASMGKPSRIVDPLGRETRFLYAPDGKLELQRDVRQIDGNSADRLTETQYDDDGRFILMENALELVTQVTAFDAANSRLPKTVVTTSPAGPGYAARTWTTETTYDAYGYIDTVTTTEASLTVSWEDFNYDTLGRLTGYTLKESETGITLRTKGYIYDSLGRLLVTIDGRGAINTADYDTAGRLIETIAAAGATFDPASLPGTTAIPIQQRTEYQYYADGSLKQQTLPEGTHVGYYYDPAVAFPAIWDRSPSKATARSANARWVVTDGVYANGDTTEQVTLMIADELGRTLQQNDLLTGQQTEFTYGEAWTDRPTLVSNSANLGSLTKVPTSTDVRQIDDRISTDRAGQVLSSQSAGKAAEHFAYDALGYLVSSEVAARLGLQQRFEHDPLGNPLSIRQLVFSPISSAPQLRHTRNLYDASGNLRQVTDAEDRVTTIDVERTNLVVSNGTNRVLLKQTTTTPDGASTSIAMDAAGQPVVQVGVFGSVTTSTFNAGGDLVSALISDPRATITPTLPGGVAQPLVTMPDRLTQYTYDPLGRLRKSTFIGDPADPASTTSGTFSTYQDFYLPSDNGEIDLVVTNDQGGTTSTTFDSVGKPIQIEHPFLGLDAFGLLRPQTIETFDYAYNASAQTMLLAHAIMAAGVGGGINDSSRVTKQLQSADGRVLVAGTRLGAGKGDPNNLPGGLNDLFNAGSGTNDYIGTALNVYSDKLDLRQSRDASKIVTSFKYDYDDENELEAGTGLRTEASDVRGKVLELYNSVGQRVVSYDFTDNVTNWTYDEIGRVTKEQTVVPVGVGEEPPVNQPVSRTWTYSDPGVVMLVNRDGKQVSTTSDYSAATIRVQTSDYQHTTYFNADGSALAVADNTLPLAGTTNFGVGQSRVVYSYDSVGRMTSETTVINQNGVQTPSTRVTMGFTGFAMNSRDLAIAPANSVAGFTSVVSTSYEIDRAGRVDLLGQNLRNASRWEAGTLPQDFAIAALYAVDGQIDRLDRFVGDDQIPSALHAIESHYGYRGDGRLESVKHERPGIGVDTIAEHSLVRTPDGRPETASAEVFFRSGAPLAQGTGTYQYDDKLNATKLTQFAAGDTPELLPGFKPLDPNGEVIADNQPLSAGGRLLGNSDRYFRYDKEGRQVTDFISGTLTDDITRMAYDIVGRLRQVEHTLDRTSPLSDIVTTTRHAYDAAGRRAATQVEADGTITTQGFYGDSSMPELVFESPTVAGTTTATIRRHQTAMPGIIGPAAISGVDGTGQTVWTLNDYAGSTRSYVAVNPDGSLAAVRHQNFDGKGLADGVLDDAPGRFGNGMLLPISFAGRERDPSTGLYAIGGSQWYDPELGRRLTAGSAAGGNDSYTLPTNYANKRLGVIEERSQIDRGTLSLVGHGVLDVIGMFPLAGIAADLLNGSWYAYEGDGWNAGLSFVAAVPGIGYTANAAKYGNNATRLYRASKAADIGHNLFQSGYAIGQGAAALSNDPTSKMGYFQIGLGAFGIGVNTTAIRRATGSLDIAPRAGGGLDAWLAAGQQGGLRRNIAAWRLNNFRNNSTRYYGVFSDDAAARLAAGGEPWPTGMSRANLGEGLYVWGTRVDAASYLQLRQLNPAFDAASRGTRIRSFRVGNRDLNRFSRLDLRNVDEATFQRFIDNHTAYADNFSPHGFEYVIYPRAAGTEHFFDRSVFQYFVMRP